MKRALVASVALVIAIVWWWMRDDEYDWRLPLDIPRPEVPVDNPMSQAKVELGRWLFYDSRLSGNQTMS